MKQQYTTLFPLNWIWAVETPVVWMACQQQQKVLVVITYKDTKAYDGDHFGKR